MSDIDDFDDGGNHGDDWMYVEDYWDEANELAEYTCPSPAPLDKISVASSDYDVHDYWQDIEYISDGGYYEDHKSPIKKRKGMQYLRETPDRSKRRRKVLDGDRQPIFGTTPVKWIPQKDRNHLLNPKISPTLSISRKTPSKSVALLANWQDKFKDFSGVASITKEGSTEKPVKGDGFDLSDLRSVAELLNHENMDALQQMLEAKGINPEALQMVMEDLLAGNERSFDNEEEQEEEDDDEYMAGERSTTEDQNTDQIIQRNKKQGQNSTLTGGGDDNANDGTGSGGVGSVRSGSTVQDRDISHNEQDPGAPGLNTNYFQVEPRQTRSKRKLRSDFNASEEDTVRGRKKHRRHL